jgi:hypothetical protein
VHRRARLGLGNVALDRVRLDLDVPRVLRVRPAERALLHTRESGRHGGQVGAARSVAPNGLKVRMATSHRSVLAASVGVPGGGVGAPVVALAVGLEKGGRGIDVGAHVARSPLEARKQARRHGRRRLTGEEGSGEPH